MWLCQIAKHEYYAWTKKQKRYANKLDENHADQGEDLLNGIINQENGQIIRKILHDLQEPYKEVFMLRVMGEVSYRDIGQLFSKSESWARVTYYRAKKTMNNTNLLKTGFVNERFRYYEKLVAELTMMSDMFMRNVLNILECAEYVLRVITENDDLELTEVVVQKDYKNLQGRSAVLDCVAVNGRKEIYDIEVQQEKAGAGPKRLRYHSSIIDAHSLFAGEDFEKLPESKVIFIVDEEVENEVAPILHIKRTVRETGRDYYNDKSEIIYINARMKENTDLGRLMHDFHCTKAEDMYSKVLAERVRVLKETQEGVEIMCKEMDKIYKAGELIGEERGKEKGKYETAMKLLELGAREDMIAEAVGHSVEEIKRWKNDMKRQ